MTNHRVGIIALLLSLSVLAACSGDRSDPLASGEDGTEFGGRLTLGWNGANIPVAEDNKLAICQVLNPELYGLWSRALVGVTTSPQTSDTLSLVRVSGAYAGYAQVEGNKRARGDDNHLFDFSLHCTLYDFSDSGKVFMGGKLAMTGYVVANGQQISSMRLVYDGGLAFAGQYSGTAVYKWMKMPIEPGGQITSAFASFEELLYYTLEGGSITLTSGSTVIHFNPYHKDTPSLFRGGAPPAE